MFVYIFRLKFIIFILSFISLSSCRTKVNKYGIPERIIYKSKIANNDTIYKLIDTLVLYKMVKVEINKENFSPSIQTIIRFYKGGKILYFVGDQELNKNYFKIEKGKQGTYYIKKNKIYFNIYSAGEGFGFLEKGHITILNDTLTLNGSKMKKHFKKIKNIPIEWLDFKPDF